MVFEDLHPRVPGDQPKTLGKRDIRFAVLGRPSKRDMDYPRTRISEMDDLSIILNSELAGFPNLSVL